MSDFMTFEEMADEQFVVVRLEFPHGKVEHYRLKVPSLHEYNEIAESVADPAIPRDIKAPNGTMLPNPENVTYKLAKQQADDERWLRQIANALEGGGMKIPGKDLEAKAEALAKVGTGRVAALRASLMQACFGIKARHEDRADRFHGLSMAEGEGEGA